MEFFGFDKKDLQGNFILSKVLEEKEKGFYEFDGVLYDYEEMEPFLIEDPKHLNGYDDSTENKKYISLNLLGKLIFHRDLKEIERKSGASTIKPLDMESLEEMAQKLVSHQERIYGKFDEQTYKWTYNKAKEDLLYILTADTPEEAVEYLRESIFFTDAEKKAAANILEQKGEFLSDVPMIIRMKEAVKQKVRVNEIVKIRVGIFQKRYRVNELDYIQYINYLIDEYVKIRKKAVLEGTNKEEDKRLEELQKELDKIARMNRDNIFYTHTNGQKAKRKTKDHILYLISRRLVEEVTGAKKIEEIPAFEIIKEDKFWDTYLFSVYVKTLIETMHLNNLVAMLNANKNNVDRYIKLVAEKRLEKITNHLKTLKPSIRQKLYKANNYNKYTINKLEWLVKKG